MDRRIQTERGLSNILQLLKWFMGSDISCFQEDQNQTQKLKYCHVVVKNVRNESRRLVCVEVETNAGRHKILETTCPLVLQAC